MVEASADRPFPKVKGGGGEKNATEASRASQVVYWRAKPFYV
jgi:hypothetical protein